MTNWLFQVEPPLELTVRCSTDYWTFIVSEKHPVLIGKEQDVQRVLREPNEIRRSKKDPNVLLFYGMSENRWLCAVVRKENGTGFVITAYPTDTIKTGDAIWIRSK
ncbi:MAG: hypothetical protein NPIRA01_21800 [Nitrospirales bacterium]|nr:MAG: hypothetical protein NPIRA01_21800 [Nitrospirales bacterium]